MIILAIDTSEARGSVTVLRDGEPVGVLAHADKSDYSEWLIPAVEEVLEGAGVPTESVDVYAVATGPGSFTGVRVGLATVKAWCEVHGKPVVAVSRLEALARSGKREAGFQAAYYDAQRGQIFAGLYRCAFGKFARIGDEMVVGAEAFLELATGEARQSQIRWVSLDPQLMTGLAGWKVRERLGDTMERGPAELATSIGVLAEQRAVAGQFTDPLGLDANYVRRSDAEIFWKGPAAHGRR